MFALLGLHYSWASPEYLLEMPFSVLVTYWVELQGILGGEAVEEASQEPDREAFKRHYGSAIKRGESR